MINKYYLNPKRKNPSSKLKEECKCTIQRQNCTIGSKNVLSSQNDSYISKTMNTTNDKIVQDMNQSTTNEKNFEILYQSQNEAPFNNNMADMGAALNAQPYKVSNQKVKTTTIKCFQKLLCCMVLYLASIYSKKICSCFLEIILV